MNRLYYIPLVLFCLVLFAFGIHADTLMLSSGDQLIGTIISETEEEYIVDVNGVPVSVRRPDVISVRKSDQEQDEEITAPPDYNIGQATETISPFIPQPATKPVSVKEETPTATPKPLLPVLVSQGKAYQVTGSGVRFRQGPNLDYEVVETLLSKTILIEIEMAEGWLHAKTLDGVEGWIHPNFVQPLQNIPCMVTGNRVNIREAPGEVYRSLGLLRKGDIVLKLKERADWWYVLSSEAIAGWCSKEYLYPLKDESLYKPEMAVVRNNDAGSPILLQTNPAGDNQQKVTFTVRDENIVIAGITKLIVFHRDQTIFENKDYTYASPDIFQRQRMNNAMEIINTGMPEQVAVTYIGGDILSLLGHKVPEGWQYVLTVTNNLSIEYGFVVQEGPARGTLILVP